MLERFYSTFRRVPRWSVVAGSLAYMGLLALVDYRVGAQLDLAVFYLPPIVAAAWFMGRRAGIVFAALGAAASSLLDSLRPGGSSTELLVWNTGAHFLFFLFVAVLVSTLSRQTVRLRILAREDPLTGIPNRRAFFGALDRAVEWSRRTGMAWVLAYLDLDNFKKVNDTRGHGVGDEVLRKVARTLREGTRKIDVVARLGGDEFALLLPETDGGRAETVVTKLLGMLEEAMAPDYSEVTFSIGVITFTTPPDSIDTAVAMADACMYRVKARGKAGAIFRSWPEEAALELPRGVAAAARMRG